MEYPSSLLWKPTEQIPAAIRLRVVALCLAIDYGFYKGTALTQDECEPFNRQSDNHPDGWVNPHEFVSWESTGNVLLAEKDMLARLIKAIEAKQIKPLHVRMNIDDVIDADETWIDLSDISEWCDVRGIEFPGELTGAYFDVEREILDEIEDTAGFIRGFKEYPDYDKNNSDGDNGADHREEHLAQSIATYNSLHNMQLKNAEQGEKPLLERERNTLLSIIAVLCRANNIDYNRHAKAAAYIKVEAEKMGIEIGESTIEGKLKLLSNAVERKSK